MHHWIRRSIQITIALILIGCTPALPLPFQAAQPTPTPAPTHTPAATPTRAPSPESTRTPEPTATLEPTLTAAPTATFEPIPPTVELVPLEQSERLDIFNRVWTLVRDRYVYEDYNGLDWEAIRIEYEPRIAAADTPEAFYQLLYQMIAKLNDEHSHYESPREVAEQQQQFEGELRYAGIGAVVRYVEEGGLITKIARNSPAEEAGLRPRDLILAINSIPFTDTERFGPGGPISMVRGEPGTTVRLRIRTSDNRIRDIDIVRRPIPSDAFLEVEGHLLDNNRIGLIRIDTFYANALDSQVRSELEYLVSNGPLDGLIIDLRDNGGGRIDLMLSTLGLVQDGGSIGKSSGRVREQELRVPAGQVIPELADTPIVVLIGPDSASAAEMFAAGIRYLGRARIVGEPSAGNTENIVPHDLADGSRLWLAELTYRLPDGTEIEGIGVQPDRVVEGEWWRYAPEDDPQIIAAIELLRKP